jgi:hypothetical protein
MPALAPIPQALLKRILELDGFKVIAEDLLNWVLVKDVNELFPIILPKIGPLVAVDVMMGALHRAQMNNGRYFELRELANAESPLAPGSSSVN